MMMFSFEYDEKMYVRVPPNSPELEYKLIETSDEQPSVQETPEINLSVLPGPTKLMRMYQARYVDVISFDEETGRFFKVDRVFVSSYVPYTWIPVRFYLDNNITWYREA